MAILDSLAKPESLRVIVPIMTFFLGTIYSIFTNKKQQKINNRSFPHFEEAYYSLDVRNNKLKENAKLYICGDYESILFEAHDNLDERMLDSEFIYAQITNLGPGHMLNCDVSLETKTTDDEKKWLFEVHVPYIKKDETILIPTIKRDMYGIRVITNNLTIRYLTHTQERMEYKYQLQKVMGDKTEIKESLYVKRWWKNLKIYKFNGKNSVFTYVRPNK